MKARVKNLLGAAALLAWLTAGVIATADVVIDDSLIARYNFDAAPLGDVIVDSSPGGSNHPGTNLEATWTALVVDGTGSSRTGAMAFDSVLGSQITVAGHDDFDFPERGTISFWMKSAGIGGGDGHPDYSMLFDRRTTTGFVLSQFGDGRLFKQSGGDVWGTTNISDDNWHHVALVYSRLAGESNYVYVDAAEDGTSVTPGDWVWPVGQQLEIGRSHDPFWKRYDGLIDDFRIYNRALTPEEITLISEGDLPELTWDGANSTWDSGAGANSHWDGGPTVGALPDADARAIVATGICAVNNAREAWSLAIEGNGVVNIAAPSGQLTVGTVVNVGPGAALNLAGTLQTAVLGTGGLNVSPGASLIVTTFFDLQSDLNMTGSTLTLNGARVTVPDGTTLTYDRPVALGSLALDGNLALTAADPADRKVAVSGGTMAVGSPALLTNGLSEVVLEDATFRIKGSIHIGATPPMPAIPGLRLHLDAGDVNGDGSPLFDGERVFTWVDKSGNGNDAMAQGEPTYIAGVPQANGQSVVRFDGSDDEYFDLPSIDDVRTAFLVLEKDADASGLKFHLGGISTHDFHPGDFNEVWHGTWAHENILTGTTIVDGFEIDGPAAQIPYDFSVLSVVTTGNVQTNRLGRDRDGFVGRNWQGDMAEIILSNEALSDAAVADVTFYLQQKYGLGPIEAIAMADTDFTVTGTSTIDAVTPRTAQFGSLTLGGTATLSGAAGGITFTGGTNIPVGTTGEVGVNLQVPTDLGGINGNGAEVVFAKSGPVELVIDSDVDSGLGMATLDVRQGELIALGGATPLDVAGLQISGGDLTLAAKAEAATFNAPLAVTADGRLAANAVAGGQAGAAVTLGSLDNGVTLSDGVTLTVETSDGYSLNVAGRVSGSGGIVVGRGDVTFSGSGSSVGSLEITGGTVGTDGIELDVATLLTLDEMNYQISGGSMAVSGADLIGAATVTVGGGTLTVGGRGPLSDPVAFYSFNDAGNPGNDDSDSGNHATLVGDAAPATGKIGPGALTLDGDGDYLQLPDMAANFGDQAATLSMWVKLNNAVPTEPTRTGWVQLDAGNGASHYPWTDGDGYFLTFRGGRVNGVDVSGIDREQWHLVTITTDPVDGWKMYQDETEMRSEAAQGGFALGGWTIGKSGGNFFLDGQIDDVYLFNRALKSGDIAGLYNGGAGPGPVPIDQSTTNLVVEADSVIASSASQVTMGNLTVDNPQAPQPPTTLTLSGAQFLFADFSAADGVTLNGEMGVRGSLSIGDGIGTLTIDGGGELDLDTDANYNAQVSLAAADAASDKIDVSDGALQLGGTLTVTGVDRADAGFFAADVTRTVVTKGLDGAIGWYDPDADVIRNNKFETVVPAPADNATSHIGQGAFLRGVDYKPAPFHPPHTTAVALKLFIALGGDADGDGKVWLSDWAALRANFGNTGTGKTWTKGNFDPWADDKVWLSDWAALRANFGNSDYTAAGAAAVPEPGTIAMLLASLAGLAAVAWRRR